MKIKKRKWDVDRDSRVGCAAGASKFIGRNGATTAATAGAGAGTLVLRAAGNTIGAGAGANA